MGESAGFRVQGSAARTGPGADGPASGDAGLTGDGPKTRKSTSLVARRVVLVLLVVAAVAVTVKYTRYYFLAKRFAVVDPGRLYRSGYCEPGPLRRVIRENGIRTILSLLNDEPDSEDQRQEEDVAREAGVRIIRIGMPGDGRADFALLDEAAAVMADPANQPLLVHCYAGVNRTGAVCAAWRMKYQGWTAEAAIAEARRHGLSSYKNPVLFDHLRRYADHLRTAGTHPAISAPT
ncbi:MAG: hypothetical protein AMXMBFR83_04720 [Phycisphaerae bacterium]